ncbi:fumarylacetoacetate hydrolase family protein [Chitinasiproducens palmae]|uniref:2-keto-4-pentenoate hydratase/2-oxohepta-3-ene-1,7-dioic acid hydratase (Catechol pathway) n=1 Tax=Chitinasiproducens palmae TaxID=1770053 RepID=A0A1H2PPH5_9BURK|nr:fumarylacetoacetate hydrolase family protein [Chitinasiproducens palmae]SDV48657.1 2-keto-4-pentenoate hydratase/2-oxohepta-3-ene-1,7-dioic acid hydratase (catechol pathway) [Chitinasiproducens palmae]
MKLVRYGAAGSERPGLIDASGQLRDLSSHIESLDAAQLTHAALEALRAIDPETLAPVEAGVRLGVPLAGIGKIVAIGLNYSDHAAEAGLPVPQEPIVFMKATSSLSGPNDPVRIPPDARKCDWEVELGIVIGKTARHVSRETARQHIAGYVLVNDVSEREWQMERGGTWDKGKASDTFCPLGPWLVTADDIPDPQNLAMWLRVNGELKQSGNTRTMIFDCETIVSYCSRFMTLHPGDVVITGTPPGVGMGMTPPQFLAAGDTMTLGIDGLGTQTLRVEAYEHAAQEA